jgi:hypothetical protein
MNVGVMKDYKLRDLQRFTHLSHTGLVVVLEHLKIKTRLTNEKFASVKGECVSSIELGCSILAVT